MNDVLLSLLPEKCQKYEIIGIFDIKIDDNNLLQKSLKLVIQETYESSNMKCERIFWNPILKYHVWTEMKDNKVTGSFYIYHYFLDSTPPEKTKDIKYIVYHNKYI